MKRVPDGDWHCPICAKEKQIPRRARTKRVTKRTAPEKLIIPENTKFNQKEQAPLAHNDSLEELKSSTPRRPILVRLKIGSSIPKLGHADKSEGKKPVESDCSDSEMVKQKSKSEANNSSDKKSTGDDNKGSDKKFSSHQPLLVRLKRGSSTLKLGSAKKAEEKKSVKFESSNNAMIEKRSKADDNNDSDNKSTGDDNNGSDKKNSLKLNKSNEEASSTSGHIVSSPRKRQKSLHESAQRLQKERKNGVPTSKKNQEVAIIFIYLFI